MTAEQGRLDGRRVEVIRTQSVAASGGAAPEADVSPAVDARAARRRRVLVGPGVAVAVLVVGGGALWLTRPNMLDTADMERTIGERTSIQAGQPVTVHCPDMVRNAEGESFRCTVRTAAGGERSVVVTITGEGAGYTWRTGN